MKAQKDLTLQIPMMIAAYQTGASVARIAESYEVPSSRVHKILKENNVRKRPRGRPCNDRARERARVKTGQARAQGKLPNMQALVPEMLADYMNGLSCQSIAIKHSTTRQNIHNIFKQHNIDSDLKPVVIPKRELKRQASQKRLVERIQASWGMSIDEYNAYVVEYGGSSNRNSPMYKYLMQRNHAKQLNVKWDFTFKTWWAIWEASGKWNQRGQGGYGLGRIGDASTPFSPNTCIITTQSVLIGSGIFKRGKVLASK